MSLLPANYDAVQSSYDHQAPDDVGIDIVLDNQIEAIEADTCLYDACQASDGVKLDCDALECCEDVGLNMVGGSIRFSIQADDVAGYREKLAKALRYLSGKLDGDK